MKNKVSIIVPIYNVEKYLMKCVDSILAQDYPDLEIILVDDGSPDGCGEMCDRIREEHDEVIVIHKENGGLSSARNAGTDIASGDYIAYIDSDDWVSRDYISHQMAMIKKYHADIAAMRFLPIWRGQQEPEIDYSSEEIKLYNKVDALEAILYGYEIPVSACKLFKAELIKRHPFPLGKLYEDVGMMYKVFSDAELVVTSSLPMYYYRRREDSIIHEKFDKRHLVIIDHAEQQYSFIKENYPELIHGAGYRCAYVSTEIAPMIVSSNDKESFKIIQDELKKHKKDLLFNPKARPKYKIRGAALLMGFQTVKIETALENKIKKAMKKNMYAGA